MACVQQEFYIAATGLLFNSQKEFVLNQALKRLFNLF